MARSPHSQDGSPAEIRSPSAEQMLHSVLGLGREIHLEMSEEAIVGNFLELLASLFPHRQLLLRVIDLRMGDDIRIYPGQCDIREGLERERLTLKKSSVEKTRLKSALASSARVRQLSRWDSPFAGVAVGFAVPLVASGELYGVLDVGYPLGTDNRAADEEAILPLANHLSVALRNERLHRETTLLRDSQAKLIEHANALILGVDRHWRITVCNQALCALTGFAREDLVGRDVRDWLPLEERARLSQMILRALDGEATDAVEVQLPTKTGESVRTVWSTAAIGVRGSVQAVVAVGQDQTRLRELQNQVIQAEKLATLGQLAAGVVHELNNPLTSITVYAEYLLRKLQVRVGEPQDIEAGDIEKMRRIAAGAQRIQAFAKDLVQYAKPAGSDSEVVSLAAVVKQSLSFCEHLFERESVILEEHIDESLPPVCAVPGQLEQVVINLVTNAVQACGSAGRVSVGTRHGENGTVALVVSDSGPGVPATDRARVFEPFFTTKSDGTGTGLGLSIVKNIIEQHRGVVWVEQSQLGGASFTCQLPPAI